MKEMSVKRRRLFPQYYKKYKADLALTLCEIAQLSQKSVSKKYT